MPIIRNLASIMQFTMSPLYYCACNEDDRHDRLATLLLSSTLQALHTCHYHDTLATLLDTDGFENTIVQGKDTMKKKDKDVRRIS